MRLSALIPQFFALSDIVSCYHPLVEPESERRSFLFVNKAQQATLQAIFTRPTKANIRWTAVEALIRSLGGEVTERAGSRVAARLNGVTAVFHRPHPQPQANKGLLDAVRQFLVNAGVKP